MADWKWWQWFALGIWYVMNDVLDWIIDYDKEARRLYGGSECPK